MERKFNKQPKLHIKKGDNVKVLSGNDKGKTGTVLSVIIEKKRAVVEGIGIVSKHMKPSASNPNGGIEKVEASIDISNLMVVDPATGDATRIGRKLNTEGKLQRFSKKTGEFI